MPDAPAATTAEHNRAAAELNSLPEGRAQDDQQREITRLRIVDLLSGA